ncbi:MAG: hypothetical protein FJ095_14165 [Deltaproteobacteria bacterium]|nr:hypothetical protein [Deltaproteobacteria bacterium]
MIDHLTPPTRLVRRLVAPALASVLGFAAVHLVAACVDHESTSPEFPGVIFGAQTNDDALRTLLETLPVEDPTQAAYLTSPMTGIAQPTTLPLTFKWRVGPSSSWNGRERREGRFTARDSLAGRAPLVAPAGPTLLPHAAPHARRASTADSRFPAWLHDLAPVSVAHAHGSPINGRAYFLVVTDANGEPVYQVFTLGFENVLGESTREELALVPQPLRASVLNAVFDNDAIIPGGGPWRGPAIDVTLTIAP